MKKKSINDTFAAQQPTNLTNPETQKPFPLELSADDWAGFAKKLDEALKEKTDDVLLSNCERARFERNVELIRRVTAADEVRNYAMLEIHEAKQWRADFRNIVELAKAFKLSKSQFYKAVKSAEINIQMAQAGLYHLKPEGRHVELLGMIDRSHRVEAWRCALAATAEKGEGTKVIERALEDYKDRLEGKPKTGRLLVESPLPFMALELEGGGAEAKQGPPDATAAWINGLDEIDEKVFERLISIDTWFASLKDPELSRGCTIANLLTSCALGFSNPTEDVDKMRQAIRLSVNKDPKMKRGFYHLGLYLIARCINQEYMRKYPR